MEQALALPDEITTEIEQAREFSSSLKIVDEESYASAVAFIAERIQPGIKRIQAWFAPLVQAADVAHKRLTQARGEALAPYQELKARVDEDATMWRRRQQQARAEQQRKEREQALAVAEARRVEQATALAESGDEEAAVELLAAPIVPKAVPSIAPSIPHVAGVVTQKRWVADVLNFVDMLKWVIEDPESRLHHVLDGDSNPMYNVKLLNALATSQRKGFAVPGCVAREVESTTFRSR